MLWTDGGMDIRSYRDAWTHLKTGWALELASEHRNPLRKNHTTSYTHIFTQTRSGLKFVISILSTKF